MTDLEAKQHLSKDHAWPAAPLEDARAIHDSLHAAPAAPWDHAYPHEEETR